MEKQSVKWYCERDDVPLSTARWRRERLGLGEFIAGAWLLTEREWRAVKEFRQRSE